jgi:hypothetical protein
MMESCEQGDESKGSIHPASSQLVEHILMFEERLISTEFFIFLLYVNYATIKFKIGQGRFVWHSLEVIFHNRLTISLPDIDVPTQLIQHLKYRPRRNIITKSSIFWDIMPWNPFKANRRFGGTYSLRLHGRRISRARNQLQNKWRRYVPPKRRLTFNRLHDAISQKVVRFITTAVRTSNPTT